VACLQGGLRPAACGLRPAAIFYPFGHPTLYVYENGKNDGNKVKLEEPCQIADCLDCSTDPGPDPTVKPLSRFSIVKLQYGRLGPATKTAIKLWVPRLRPQPRTWLLRLL
jgi:hypothetical protein